MAIITRDEYKTFAWISLSDTSQDSRIDAMIAASEAVVNDLLDNVEESQRTETLDICELCNRGRIYLKSNNLTSIDFINGEAYTGVSGTDYLIVWTNAVQFFTVENFYKQYEFGVFTITYTAWWEMADIPENIKTATKMLTQLMLSSKGGREVKEYRLWPRTIKLSIPDSSDAIMQIGGIEQLLSRYKLAIIRRIPC